jgi:hypothetical protein
MVVYNGLILVREWFCIDVDQRMVDSEIDPRRANVVASARVLCRLELRTGKGNGVTKPSTPIAVRRTQWAMAM